MARSNTQTNTLIKWTVMLVDLLMLNGILILFRMWSPTLQTWSVGRTETLWVVCNLAMALSMWKFSTIIHLRMVSGGDILRKVFELTVTQTLIAYLIMKLIEVNRPIGWMLVDLGVCQMLVMTVLRVLERLAIKQFRQLGMNTRTVTFVGDDSELSTLYTMLKGNPTLGYRVVGLYTNANPIAEQDEKDNKIPVFGTVSDLIEAVEREEPLTLGDELYVCLSRREREKVKILSDYCDRHVIRFYYVPISVEQLGMRLKRELYEDMELFTTYEPHAQVTQAAVRPRDVADSPHCRYSPVADSGTDYQDTESGTGLLPSGTDGL